jgi:transcriptional regulator with XRE-family HTH domain
VDNQATGERIKAIRERRKMTLRQVAELAGISHGWLGKIERGLVPLPTRQTREGVARALRVAPALLGGPPYLPTDEAGNEAEASVAALEAALTEWWPGEVPDDRPAREWGYVKADLANLVERLRPRSDYARQGDVLPGLIHDLLVYGGDPKHEEHRDQAHRGLVAVYQASGNLLSRLGVKHLGYTAAERVQQSADRLGDPHWLGVAAWTRAHFVSDVSRPRQYSLAVRAAELETARLESRGMGHLTAALAAASQGDEDMASTHLNEADKMAVKLGMDNSSWGLGTMNFGKGNVGVWRVTIGVEEGAGSRIAEVARGVPWQAMPLSRQGVYWMDLGRGLLRDKRTHHKGLQAMAMARELTPQQLKTNQFARDALQSAVTVAIRDAGGPTLRELCQWLGVNPTG